MFEFPQWFYSPDANASEAVLCETEADIPEGFLPHRVREASEDRASSRPAKAPKVGRPAKPKPEPETEPDDLDLGEFQ